VTTWMSTVPALPGWETAVMLVAELMVKPAAAAVPKLTAVAPVRFKPLMATVVPPAVLPVVGLMPVTAGGAR
jgi:hypothetical protein